MATNIRQRNRLTQPLEAAQHDDALLKIATAQAISGLGKTTIYAKIAAGELEAIRLGKRCTRLRAGSFMSWLRAQGK